VPLEHYILAAILGQSFGLAAGVGSSEVWSGSVDARGISSEKRQKRDGNAGAFHQWGKERHES
jgi:hypothetical protein